MKRLLVALAVIGLVALPLSNLADPPKKPAKKKDHDTWLVCHITPASPVVEGYVYGTVLALGSEAAADSHVAHGDMLISAPSDPGEIIGETVVEVDPVTGECRFPVQ